MSSEPGGVELSVIRTAEVPAPYGYLFRAEGNAVSRLRAGTSAGDDALRSPCLAFVLRHSTAGVILVDTGFHRDARENLRDDFGIPMSLLLKSLRPAEQPFDEQLRDVGVEPDSVHSVIMTHLHVDPAAPGRRALGAARGRCRLHAGQHPRGAASDAHR